MKADGVTVNKQQKILRERERERERIKKMKEDEVSCHCEVSPEC